MGGGGVSATPMVIPPTAPMKLGPVAPSTGTMPISLTVSSPDKRTGLNGALAVQLPFAISVPVAITFRPLRLCAHVEKVTGVLASVIRPPPGAAPRYCTRTFPPLEQLATNPACACSGTMNASISAVRSGRRRERSRAAVGTPLRIAAMKAELISDPRLGATPARVRAGGVALGPVGGDAPPPHPARIRSATATVPRDEWRFMPRKWRSYRDRSTGNSAQHRVLAPY